MNTSNQLPPHEKEQMVARYRKEMQGALIEVGFWVTCLNCENWAPNTRSPGPTPPPGCALFNSMPPPDVIVFGCEKWEINVPF